MIGEAKGINGAGLSDAELDGVAGGKAQTYEATYVCPYCLSLLKRTFSCAPGDAEAAKQIPSALPHETCHVCGKKASFRRLQA